MRRQHVHLIDQIHFVATRCRGVLNVVQQLPGIVDLGSRRRIDLDEIDEIVRVTTDDAIEASRAISREEGLLVGISSGANVLAAMQVARELGPGHSIVTMLCDRGERYLSVNGRS